jgi:hypothetical protein
MKTGTTWTQSTFWSEEPPAKASPSPVCEKDSKTPVEDSCLPTLKSLGVSGLDGLCGKMSPASCLATEDGILVPSSGRWGSWGMAGPIASWTLNGSEHNDTPAPSRSAGDVSSLSDVLETGPVPPRFFLSPKACAGILRRAEKRKKTLPEHLRLALEAGAGVKTSISPALDTCKSPELSIPSAAGTN